MSPTTPGIRIRFESIGTNSTITISSAKISTGLSIGNCMLGPVDIIRVIQWLCLVSDTIIFNENKDNF